MTYIKEPAVSLPKSSSVDLDLAGPIPPENKP